MSHEEMMAGASFFGVFRELLLYYFVMDVLLYGVASVPGLIVAGVLLARQPRRQVPPVAIGDQACQPE